MPIRTTLRIHRDDTTQPAIAIPALANLAHNMVRLADVVVLELTGQQVSHELRIVANPRQGSLQIVLEPHVYLNAEVALQFKDAAVATAAAATSVLATVPLIDLIWKVIFGGQGLIDLLRSRPATQDLPENTSGELRFKLTVAHSLIAAGTCKDVILDTLQAARNLGADQVDIILEGEAPVPLLTQQQRTPIGSLGQYADRPPATPPKGLTGILRDLSSDLQVRYHDMIYNGFMATIDGHKYFCIWGPRETSAPWEPHLQVVVEPIDIAEIEPIGDTQYEHALAEAALMIRGYLATR